MEESSIVPADNEVARVRLGLMLRNLRQARGLSGADLGRLAHISQSKVSKIETGALRNLDERDVLAMLDHLAPPPDLRQQVLVQFELSRVSPLNLHYIRHHGVNRKQHEIRMREKRAKLICVYECAVIPGLLQTPDYTMAMFSRLGLRPEEAADAARQRTLRQEVLRQRGREFRFVISHSALYSTLSGPALQEAQLDRLIRVALLPNVRIGIVPLEAGLPLHCGNPFTIIDSMHVTAETVIAEQQCTDRQQIADYIALFTELERRATYDEQAERLIAAAIDALEC